MYAVATPNEVVQKRITLFQDARIPLKIIDIPEMAQRNVAALFESQDKATAMLAFSPWGGLLTILVSGRAAAHAASRSRGCNWTKEEHGDHYRERVATEITPVAGHFERQRLRWVGSCVATAGPKSSSIFLHGSSTCRCGAVCRSHGILPARASRRRKTSGNIFTCSERPAVEEKALVSQQDQSLHPLISSRRENIFRIGHDPGVGLIALGMAAFTAL